LAGKELAEPGAVGRARSDDRTPDRSGSKRALEGEASLLTPYYFSSSNKNGDLKERKKSVLITFLGVVVDFAKNQEPTTPQRTVLG
jgi:hypothetical protein